MMRILTAAFLFSLAVTAAAQSLSESVEVHVMEIEAVVLDAAGKPVPNLGRTDFEVKIDGRPAEVTNFFAVNRGEIVEARESGAETTADSAVTRVPTRLIVVIDDLHLHQSSRNRALEALKNYVGTSTGPKNTMTIIRWNGSLKTVLRPTGDRDLLLRTLGEIKREPAGMVRADNNRRFIMRQIDDVILHPILFNQDAQAADAMAAAMTYAKERTREVESTVIALSELITVMSGLDGRKVILYVSEALPQQPGADVLDYARQVFTNNAIEGFQLEHNAGGRQIDAAQFDQSRAFRNLALLATSAGVVFSALDPGGARNVEGSGVEYATSLARLDSMFIRDNESAGARAIASETGGRYISNENNLDHAISILTDDVTTFYSIGVRPPDRFVSESMSIVVNVKGRDDLRVLTPRRHAVRTEKEAIASAIRARLHSREEANPLGVTFTTGTPWPRNGRCIASVQLNVPSEKIAPLEEPEVAVHAIVLDDRGQESPVRSSAHTVPGTIAFEFGLKPRRYVISLAVIEKTTNETSYLQKEIDATICGR